MKTINKRLTINKRQTKNRQTKNRQTKRKSYPKVSNSYIIAIPSYNSSDVLAQKTLATLHEGSVPASKIHIFVANKSEYDKYEAAIPKHLYGKMVIGKLGISNQRRFIVEYFPKGQKIVSLDDDIEKILKKTADTKLCEIKDIDAFFKAAFDRLHKENLYIWGVYPTPNPFFMRGGVTTKLKFIIGGLYGFINRPNTKDIRISGNADQKEDIEQSILYYIKDGGVIRYNNVAFKTKFHAPGGLGQTKDRIEANLVAAEYLSQKYPQYATMWKRPNGMAEIRLRSA
jgi:hypothetical protein